LTTQRSWILLPLLLPSGGDLDLLRSTGDALVMDIRASGAKFKLVPWDATFSSQASCRLAGWAHSRFELHDKGIRQFQMDKEGKLNLCGSPPTTVGMSSHGRRLIPASVDGRPPFLR
jgi:hypothetical protein